MTGKLDAVASSRTKPVGSYRDEKTNVSSDRIREAVSGTIRRKYTRFFIPSSLASAGYGLRSRRPATVRWQAGAEIIARRTVSRFFVNTRLKFLKIDTIMDGGKCRG